MRSRLAPALALLLASACTCDDGGHGKPVPPRTTGQDPAYRHATIRKTCGPTGSESLLLVLASSGQGCAPVSAERVTISISRSEIAAPANLELSGFGSAGTGRLCPQGGSPCSLAKTGKLVLERYEEGSKASGSFELELPARGAVRGRYDATWCPAEGCTGGG